MIANTRITINFQSLFAILCIAQIQICLSFNPNTCLYGARSSFSSVSNSKISRKPILVNRFEKALYMSSESEPPLTAFLDKLSKTGLDNTRIQKDSLVIAKYDLPELGKKSPEVSMEAEHLLLLKRTTHLRVFDFRPSLIDSISPHPIYIIINRQVFLLIRLISFNKFMRRELLDRQRQEKKKKIQQA